MIKKKSDDQNPRLQLLRAGYKQTPLWNERSTIPRKDLGRVVGLGPIGFQKPKAGEQQSFDTEDRRVAGREVA